MQKHEDNPTGLGTVDEIAELIQKQKEKAKQQLESR